jgi:hypothetical protein
MTGKRSIPINYKPCEEGTLTLLLESETLGTIRMEANLLDMNLTPLR